MEKKFNEIILLAKRSTNFDIVELWDGDSDVKLLDIKKVETNRDIRNIENL